MCKTFCVRFGRAENKAKQFSRPLTFAFIFKFPQTPHFERPNPIALWFAEPTQTQSSLPTYIQLYSQCIHTANMHERIHQVGDHIKAGRPVVDDAQAEQERAVMRRFFENMDSPRPPPGIPWPDISGSSGHAHCTGHVGARADSTCNSTRMQAAGAGLRGGGISAWVTVEWAQMCSSCGDTPRLRDKAAHTRRFLACAQLQHATCKGMQAPQAHGHARKCESAATRNLVVSQIFGLYRSVEFVQGLKCKDFRLRAGIPRQRADRWLAKAALGACLQHRGGDTFKARQADASSEAARAMELARLRGGSFRDRKRPLPDADEEPAAQVPAEPEQSFVPLLFHDRGAHLFSAYLQGEDIRPLKLTREEREMETKLWRVRVAAYVFVRVACHTCLRDANRAFAPRLCIF
jgi:hypothetical protein